MTDTLDHKLNIKIIQPAIPKISKTCYFTLDTLAMSEHTQIVEPTKSSNLDTHQYLYNLRQSFFGGWMCLDMHKVHRMKNMQFLRSILLDFINVVFYYSLSCFLDVDGPPRKLNSDERYLDFK